MMPVNFMLLSLKMSPCMSENFTLLSGENIFVKTALIQKKKASKAQ